MRGVISTIAGTGEPGHTGDGHSAELAQLREPFMCEFDSQGNLYIAEATNHCIRRLDSKSGTLSTLAGIGKAGYSGDGEPATKASFNEPYSLQLDHNGDIYVIDRLNAAIRKINASNGLIDTTVGGKNTDVFIEPNDCFLDQDNGLLVADVQKQQILRVNLVTSQTTTIAGDGKKSREGDGKPALKASLMGPRAICLDSQGNLYICEREGNSIRKIDRDGIMTTVSGNGKPGYDGDGGHAINATWRGPKAIRCDNQDNLIVVDTENHAVRRIDRKTSIVTTVAGGHRGNDGDGGPATRAGLDRPHGCSIDREGNLYIADSDNHRIRRVQG